MPTTIDDARIVLKIDTTQAEQAAEEFLRKRKGGGARGAGGGGGPRPPAPGGGPSPADEPEPQDGGPGVGAQTLAALASGNVAGIPGLRVALGAAKGVFFLEALQTISGLFAGFFDPDGNLIDKAARALFHTLEEKIGKLEALVTGILDAVAATREGYQALEAQAVLGGGADVDYFSRVVRTRLKLATAMADLREAQQQLGREMIGQDARDKADAFRDKIFENVKQAFGGN